MRAIGERYQLSTSGTITNVGARRGRGWMAILLLGAALLFLGGVRPAHAADLCVANHGGIGHH